MKTYLVVGLGFLASIVPAHAVVVVPDSDVGGTVGFLTMALAFGLALRRHLRK